MTPSDLELLRAKYPISEAVARRNLGASDAHCESPTSEPQCRVQTLAVGPHEAEASHPEKRLVRIESRRTRLTDPDNGMSKWHIDALRYAGILHDDTPDEIELALSQVKVATKEEECTVITITPL